MLSAGTLRLDWAKNGRPRAALDLGSALIFGVAAMLSRQGGTVKWCLLQEALLSATTKLQATMQSTVQRPQDGFEGQYTDAS